MTDYDIQGPARVCAATGRELKPGDRFFAVLTEERGQVRPHRLRGRRVARPARRTRSRTGRARCRPPHKPRKPVVNDDLLLDCFDRLKDTADPDGLNFRYVAALLLMRRKRFKFEDAVRDDAGRDVLILTRRPRRRDPSGGRPATDRRPDRRRADRSVPRAGLGVTASGRRQRQRSRQRRPIPLAHSVRRGVTMKRFASLLVAARARPADRVRVDRRASDTAATTGRRTAGRCRRCSADQLVDVPERAGRRGSRSLNYGDVRLVATRPRAIPLPDAPREPRPPASRGTSA